VLGRLVGNDYFFGSSSELIAKRRRNPFIDGVCSLCERVLREAEKFDVVRRR